MSDTLPTAIRHYFEASQVRDANAMSRCFTTEGTVSDEHHTYKGPDAIATWAADTLTRYQITCDVLAYRSQGARWKVTTRVSGQFSGSPLDFTYVFTVADDPIASLEISL